jgi:hypothetical protein
MRWHPENYCSLIPVTAALCKSWLRSVMFGMICWNVSANCRPRYDACFNKYRSYNFVTENTSSALVQKRISAILRNFDDEANIYISFCQLIKIVYLKLLCRPRILNQKMFPLFISRQQLTQSPSIFTDVLIFKCCSNCTATNSFHCPVELNHRLNKATS